MPAQHAPSCFRIDGRRLLNRALGLQCLGMARFFHILWALLWTATAALPVVSIQPVGGDTRWAASESDPAGAVPEDSSEGPGPTDAPDKEEDEESSDSAAPDVVLAIQAPQAQRVLTFHRLAAQLTGQSILAHADVHAVHRLESTIRLNRSWATDLAARVPQLWRHAPPRQSV